MPRPVEVVVVGSVVGWLVGGAVVVVIVVVVIVVVVVVGVLLSVTVVEGTGLLARGSLGSKKSGGMPDGLGLQ